jgi:hypothetical protein
MATGSPQIRPEQPSSCYRNSHKPAIVRMAGRFASSGKYVMHSTQNQNSPQTANAASQSSQMGESLRNWNWILHGYAAFAVAVAMPMYGRLQQRTPYLISLDAISVVVFVMIWSILVPLALLSAIAFCRRHGPRLGAAALHGLIATSTLVIVLGTFSHRSLSGGFGWLILLGGLAAGATMSNRYQYWSWLRSVMTVAAFGSLLAPASLILGYYQAAVRPVISEKLSVGNPVPIVIVVFDCFSGTSLMDAKRHVDPDRYPNFAELANSSTWYRNCSSVHPRTNRAVPAILSGRLSALGEHPPNLFTLLQATDRYQLTSFEPFTVECPPDFSRDRVQPNPWTQWINLTYTVGAVFLHDLIPPDVPLETPHVPRTWFGLDHINGADRQQLQGLIRYSWDIRRDIQFEHFLDCLTTTDKPNIWFGHFALPHFPWNYLPSGVRYGNDQGLRQEWGTEGPLSERWTTDEFLVRQAQQQHLLQTGYTDLLIGQLLQRLRSLDLYDRCLLIVTADHGVSFRPGISGREPTDKSLAEIMNVPLFIKLPGQKDGDIVDLNVETTDILPTILDVIQLKSPVALHGQSVVSDFSERPKKFFYDDNRTFEVDASFDGRYEVLGEQLAMFGTGEDPLRIFKIGPHSELIGQNLGQLQIASKSTIEIQPINFASEVAFNRGQVVPTYPEAKIVASGATEPIRFAVAINDVIWGTTQTCRPEYLHNYWRCMLPESSFHDGINTVRIFEINDRDGELKLAECFIGPSAPVPILPFEQIRLP